LRQQRIWGDEIRRASLRNADTPGRGAAIQLALPSMSATSWLPNLILAPLVAFGLYRRFKRSFGRQLVRPRRMVLRMVVLSGVCALFLWWLPTRLGIAGALAGLAVGGGLALVDLAHTELEVTADGTFYTPNRWIGLVVTSLFVGRLTVRLFTVYEHAAQVGQGTPTSPTANGLPKSPLTLALYFLLATYYVGYYAGLLRRERSHTR
jgi:hypothetical protein